MDYVKRRLSVFLCMLMVFTTAFCVVPSQSVQAATTTNFSWIVGGSYNVTDSDRQVVVEKNAKNLYIGDYVSAYQSGDSYKYYGYLSVNSGVTYTSTKPSVVKVDKKTGKITAKKTGTATVKIKFKGASTQIKVKVEKSLKSKRPYNYASTKKAANGFIKAYGKGITSKNRYAVLSAYKLYGAEYRASSYSSYYENGKTVYYLCLPEAGRYAALSGKLTDYAEKRNPFGTDHSKEFCITSLSGKGQTITATLSGKVTADQIFGAQYATKWGTKVSEAKQTSFALYIMDADTEHRYFAEATMKKGSNKLTIKTKNLKLKKGKKYKLTVFGSAYSNYSVSWLMNSRATEFKAK